MRESGNVCSAGYIKNSILKLGLSQTKTFTKKGVAGGGGNEFWKKIEISSMRIEATSIGRYERVYMQFKLNTHISQLIKVEKYSVEVLLK